MKKSSSKALAYGYRTATNVIENKNIRQNQVGFEQFEDYWTDSEHEVTLSYRSELSNSSYNGSPSSADEDDPCPKRIASDRFSSSPRDDHHVGTTFMLQSSHKRRQTTSLDISSVKKNKLGKLETGPKSRRISHGTPEHVSTNEKVIKNHSLHSFQKRNSPRKLHTSPVDEAEVVSPAGFSENDQVDEGRAFSQSSVHEKRQNRSLGISCQKKNKSSESVTKPKSRRISRRTSEHVFTNEKVIKSHSPLHSFQRRSSPRKLHTSPADEAEVVSPFEFSENDQVDEGRSLSQPSVHEKRQNRSLGISYMKKNKSSELVTDSKSRRISRRTPEHVFTNEKVIKNHSPLHSFQRRSSPRKQHISTMNQTKVVSFTEVSQIDQIDEERSVSQPSVHKKRQNSSLAISSLKKNKSSELETDPKSGRISHTMPEHVFVNEKVIKNHSFHSFQKRSSPRKLHTSPVDETEVVSPAEFSENDEVNERRALSQPVHKKTQNRSLGISSPKKNKSCELVAEPKSRISHRTPEHVLTNEKVMKNHSPVHSFQRRSSPRKKHISTVDQAQVVSWTEFSQIDQVDEEKSVSQPSLHKKRRNTSVDISSLEKNELGELETMSKSRRISQKAPEHVFTNEEVMKDQSPLLHSFQKRSSKRKPCTTTVNQTQVISPAEFSDHNQQVGEERTISQPSLHKKRQNRSLEISNREVNLSKKKHSSPKTKEIDINEDVNSVEVPLNNNSKVRRNVQKNNKTISTKTKFNKILEKNERPQTFRKSSRNRMQPLKFWKNERQLFRFESGDIVLIDTIKGSEDCIAPAFTGYIQNNIKKIKNNNKIQNELKYGNILSKYDWRFNEIPWVCPDHEESGFHYRFKKVIKLKSFTSGFIEIDASNAKPPQFIPNQDAYFIIISGNVIFNIEGSIHHLKENDSVTVPKHTFYAIENFSNEKPALISFVMSNLQ